MSGAGLVLHQFRFDQKTFWRNPASVFFTVMFPVIFLVIFELLFGSEDLEGIGISASTYYIPAIITLAVISATFQSLAMNLTVDRENGLLKRTRGTPLPSWAFIAGRVGNSIVVAVLMLILVAGLGRIAYGVPIPWEHLPSVFVTLAVGAASFCCLGFALTTVIPSQEAAAPITNVAVLPLYFLSGVFVPESEIPPGVISFSEAFPVRHFFEAFLAAWNPATTGSALELGDLAVVAAWGLAGLLVAVTRFRWVPRRG